ncbi:MAG: hypothetical protein OSB83_08405 [Planctomycetota bacterium]|nr:hypothetical protein [Planctomycetota bacterium]
MVDFGAEIVFFETRDSNFMMSFVLITDFEKPSEPEARPFEAEGAVEISS